MNEKGFTLVETLVALVVGGLLLGSISWVIAGLSNDLKVTEQSDRDFQTSIVANLLDDLLADGRFSDASSRPLLRSPRILEFQMRAPLSIGQSGYIDARLVVERDAQGESLKLDFPGQEISETVLLSEMEEIVFHYAVDQSANVELIFLKKIEIAVDDSSGSEPQIIVVHPHVNALGACVFDLISQQCRT
ncbi:type II secretion system protein [Parasphingorhabdus sp.]|uniref:type II secretion system protein n=1 Tax=Parasphingorhabdus sp. TaxID=2709688 RepID=UPI0032661790